MPKLILFFNHTLTGRQQDAARRDLGVENIVEPPAHVKEIWAEIPAEQSEIESVLAPVFDWLTAHAQVGDFILIQGDFGACYLLVRYALAKRLVPIYSTTDREVRERHLDDSSVQLEHTFKHVRFREYGM